MLLFCCCLKYAMPDKLIYVHTLSQLCNALPIEVYQVYLDTDINSNSSPGIAMHNNSNSQY